MTHEDIEGVVKRAAREAVLETLGALGFDTEDRPALRADMAHLRRWRVSVENVGARATMTAVTIIVAGLVGWLGMVIGTALHLRGSP